MIVFFLDTNKRAATNGHSPYFCEVEKCGQCAAYIDAHPRWAAERGAATADRGGETVHSISMVSGEPHKPGMRSDCNIKVNPAGWIFDPDSAYACKNCLRAVKAAGEQKTRQNQSSATEKP